MATTAALKALADTSAALKDIRTKVQPLLETLRHDNDPDAVAQARAGVALTLGTLRFLAQRLRGQTVAASLRLELNRMRQLLVKVQQKAKAKKSSSSSPTKRQQKQQDAQVETAATSPATPAAKRRRIK